MKVLVVEDSQLVSRVLQRLFQTADIPLEIIFCESLLQAQEKVDLYEDIFAALVDLNLPDAPHGEIVDFILAQNIPTIVLTGSYDDDKRESLLQQGVVDYIIKESRFSYEYAVQLVHRLLKNQEIKVLLVEDSSSYRLMVRKQLEKHLYQVIEARDGQEGLAKLQQDPEIKLILTDYEMPNMNGIELVQNIRRDYETSELKIIGLSAADSPALSAKFIKSGANDFLTKPFNYEELHCRVMHNIEQMELIAQIKDAANRDFLTGLHNRRYLFEQSEKLLAQPNNKTCLAMMDLDFFKRINDNYGHDAGDAVLTQLATLLDRSFNRFLHARIGGEEFCILLNGLNLDQAEILMQHFCTLVHDTEFVFGDQVLPVTVSIGLIEQDDDNFDQMISRADEMLYQAKEAGRNTVKCE
ncbi:diguanylate cyclase [Neptuniibacter sp. QD34_54]|uniref:diguanylate cyclase n=1 Tax=Neptuniibacter sp. QD34_54 TaxID=3398208 RepID=UPI0039F56CFC